MTVTLSDLLRSTAADARGRLLGALLIVGLLTSFATASTANAADPWSIVNFDGTVLQQNGDPATQAGSHPFTASTVITIPVTNEPDGDIFPTEAFKDITVDLPPGFVANPNAVGSCTPQQINGAAGQSFCPSDSQVGIVGLLVDSGKSLQILLHTDIEHAEGAGKPAVLAFNVIGNIVHITGKLRPEDGYSLSALSLDAPQALTVSEVKVILWGTPADPVWDLWRDTCIAGNTGLPATPTQPGCPIHLDREPVPFVTLPTSCVGPVSTKVTVTTWEGSFDTASFLSHDNALPVPNPIGVDGCGSVPFDPVMDVVPTSTAPDSASGVDADLSVPSDGLLDPEGLSQAHLKKAVVTLPEGMSVNPSGATGLGACSDGQLALGTDVGPSCPDSSKIGTVDVTTPLIDEHLTGDVVLRTPNSTDPASGEMFRMAIIARNDERGLLVKLPGSAVADPATGRLTATFDDNPQLPFERLKVSFKSGSRGLLALPQNCGSYETSATLTPWSGNAPVMDPTPVSVSGDCRLGFSPKLAAGSSSRKARGSGAFSFKFSRQDGEQWVNGLTAELPKGLLASVKGVPLCSSAQATAGACPAGSRVGTVDATAGSGSPFVLERKGDAYLTEGYKGCAYGLAVKVPVVAGPFDASSPETDLGSIVVRQAVCVDPSTAQVTVKSDPLPTIWHGIPLRMRSVTVNVDRSGFMLNPSDCSAKTVGATFLSPQGASALVTAPFNVDGCATLPFKPKLALSLTGKKETKTGKHPGLTAKVTQKGVGEAGIEQAVVRLPKSLALDPDNAQALCEFDAGTKPDLDKRCPKGSIVGKASATSPLLNKPLTGNVYFVKNIRIDPKTGNQIRTLPMIIVALRGEIAVNLKGESSTTKSGKLVNTFDNVPDAPISQFNLTINGGKRGILAVTRTRRAKINLCAGRHTAEVDTDGQNARHHDFNVQMKTPCTKKQAKRAKRAAAKARTKS